MFHFDVLYLAAFLPAVIVLYAGLKKLRIYILLLASLFLFYTISGFLVLYVLASALSIYGLGNWLGRLQEQRRAEVKQLTIKEEKKAVKAKYEKKQRRVVALAVLIHIGFLLVLKYSGFVLGNVNSLLAFFDISFRFYVPKFMLPIGISFFSLEALSYVIDVYHEKFPPEKNPVKLTLFLSFFAYLIEGPIVKYEDVKDSLFSGAGICYDNLTFGLQRILYGVFKKFIIADRLNIMIKTVFGGYEELGGSVIFVGAVCYTIQLYAEFSGTMDVALGTAEIFGVKLPENFRSPFFSRSISEFWQRWHITLGRWFKDYIFYPVSLSAPMKKLTTKARKKFGNYYGPVLVGGVALFLVWFSNGLWHGAEWKYIFFGLYHFTLIFIASLLKGPVTALCKKMRINMESKAYHVMQIIKTSFFVVIGELFFRAESLRAGFAMLGRIFTNFDAKALFDGSLLLLGVDACDYLVVALIVVVIFTISLLKERGHDVRMLIASRPIVMRWAFYYALILSIAILGAYGPKYVPIQPIYAEF